MTYDEHEAPAAAGRLALASLSLSMLLASLGISIATVALPDIGDGLSISMAGAQWVILAYLLATTVAIVPAGRLGDIHGQRRVLVIGLTVYVVASVLCALAVGAGMLVGARVLQGLGAACLMALSVSAVRQSVPPEKTGRAMGLLGSMSAVGTALGPAVGGLLVAGSGWRAVFAALVPLALAALALAWRHLPADAPGRAGRGERLDWPGTLVLAGTVAAYALAMTAGEGRFDAGNLLLLAAAGIGVVALVSIERRARHPIIAVGAFASSAFSTGLVMNVLVSAIMMATLVVGPFFLAFGLGLSDVLVGLVMAIGPITAALSGVPAGRLTDRFGAPRVLGAGLVQLAIGAFALALLPPRFGTAGYALAFIVLTPGYQLFLAALNTQTMMGVAADRRGVASGLLSLSRNLGFITGASVLGAVFAVSVGQSDIASASPDAVARGLQTTFALGGIMALTALAIALTSRKVIASFVED